VTTSATEVVPSTVLVAMMSRTFKSTASRMVANIPMSIAGAEMMGSQRPKHRCQAERANAKILVRPLTLKPYKKSDGESHPEFDCGDRRREDGRASMQLIEPSYSSARTLIINKS